jgi:hypothetical protein
MPVDGRGEGRRRTLQTSMNSILVVKRITASGTSQGV